MKRSRFALIVLAVFLFVLQLPVTALADTGWNTKGGKEYYYYDDEGTSFATGLNEIDGKMYYFADDGVLAQSKWVKQTGTYDDGEAWTDWYYAGSSGELATGWQKIGTKWYFFENTDGSWPYMYSGGEREIAGKHYYFYDNGALGIGWIKETHTSDEGDTWSNWYYANSSGVMQTGWQKINNKWYYFEPGGEDWFGGHMYAGGVYEIGSKKYFFNDNGAMGGPGWVKEVNSYKGTTWTNWYYTNKGGDLVTSAWKQIGGRWYWFDGDGRMASGGSERIGNKVYVFEDSGALVNKAGWKSFTEVYESGSYTYWYYANADGTARVGWLNDGGTWYYFNDWGFMVVGGRSLNGTLNLFSSSGAWQGEYKTPGWKKVGNDWFYVKSNGKTASGWEKISGKWYYFNEYGSMVQGSYAEINGKFYFFEFGGALVSKASWQKMTYSDGDVLWFYVGADGVCKDGWQKINGKWYYFHKDYPCMEKDGWVYVVEDGKEYEFGADGAWTGASR